MNPFKLPTPKRMNSKQRRPALETMGRIDPTKLDSTSLYSRGWFEEALDIIGVEIVEIREMKTGQAIFVLRLGCTEWARRQAEDFIRDNTPAMFNFEVHWAHESLSDESIQAFMRKPTYFDEAYRPVHYTEAKRQQGALIKQWKNRITRAIYGVANFLGSFFR